MTRSSILLASMNALLLVAASMFAGCDSSSNPTASSGNPVALPAGARILTVSGHVRDSTGNVRIQVRQKSVKPDASGNYSVVDTIRDAQANPSDTARIVVSTPSRTDTLRKVPLSAWSTILTPLSVVANDVSVNAATGSKISGKILEAVWWADDSIAHVLRVPNSTSADYFSTTIYTLYNDSAYAVNGHKYFIFLRAKTAVTDTLPVAATSIRDIGAQNGALNYTDTFFRSVDSDSMQGSLLVPHDSNVVKYSIKHAVIPPDSLVVILAEKYIRGDVSYVDTITSKALYYSTVSVSFDLDSAALAAYKHVKDSVTTANKSLKIVETDSIFVNNPMGVSFAELKAGHHEVSTVYVEGAGCFAGVELVAWVHAYTTEPGVVRYVKGVRLPARNVRVVYSK